MIYSGAVDSISIVELGPVIAAVVGPMLAAVIAMMRYQHNDSTKTRELITEARREASEEARALNAETRAEFRDALERQSETLKDIVVSLADARERLARIEGHLGIGIRPRDDNSAADAA